jgi:hypothetical protein
VGRATLVIVVLLIAVSTAACGGSESRKKAEASTLPQGSETVKLDPDSFTTNIDNPYWPMAPGARWVFRETNGRGQMQRVEVTVTGKTRKILGIEARVVHDIVTERGRIVEDTIDWYAQDADGNLWYLGENTKEYANGKVSTEGSWLAGVNGAQPGVVVPAHAAPGLGYRQEYLAGQAEDSAQILSVTENVEVPYGSFAHVLMTKDFTPLDPKLVELKFYANGVGPVLVVPISGGSGREELLSFEKAG